ncbi:MAG: hypothetical protein RI967_186 [Planctomycetota bacterium]
MSAPGNAPDANAPDAAEPVDPAAVPATPAQGSPFARGSNSSFNSPSGPGMRPMRRNDGPRRLKNGIRFRRREGLEALVWPAEAWNALVFAGIEQGVKDEGLDYARAGQTAMLQITATGVEASVQGRQPRPYTVRIEAETLSASDWDKVVTIMAREAVYSAKLLAGEMPPLVEQPFQSLGRSLVPADASAIARTCTCDLPNPCKHVACVAALVAERIAGDPLLAFTLRGLDGQKLLERLQEARAIATRGVARAHSNPPCVDAVPEPVPLEKSVGSFWRPGRQLDEAPSETEGFVAHALLKRLGQPPLAGKFPMVGLLASIYDSIAAEARALRDAADARDARHAPPPPADDASDEEAWMDEVEPDA